MSLRHKHLAEWTEAHAGRRYAVRPHLGRETWPPRALHAFAAAARFVERATRRHGV
jgi:hypothetical protein